MYKEIAQNKRRTILFMLLFVLLVGALGWLAGEMWGRPYITPYVLIGALVYAVLSYWTGSRAALAMSGAHEIQKKDSPRLWRTVENLSIATGMPMPKVYLIDDPAPNAFATGRDPKHAAVAATTGLVDMMTDTELEGVMAHELGHVKNYDIRVTMIAFALVAVVSMIADIMIYSTWFGSGDRDRNSGNGVFVLLGIAGALLAPFIALLIQMAVSRKREYLADATGALTTRYPEGLASALEKIGKYNRPMRKQHTATAHLFIANPLQGKSMTSLFSTHPPVEERVARLRQMTAQA